MSKKKKLTGDIPEKKLKELFERCDGRRSHYLILTDEPQDFLDLLEQEGWILTLKNGGNRPWYTATMKLITKFRDLADHEVKQEDWQNTVQAVEAIEEAKEEARVEEHLDKRKKLQEEGL